MILSLINIRYALPLTTMLLLISCDNTNDHSNTQGNLVSTEYTCEDGKLINVTYSKTEQQSLYAKVNYKNSKYTLKRVKSASGEKYSDDTNTWWSKGDTGFLQIGDVTLLKNCTSKKPDKQMHPSWDKNNDSINDCESDGSCDHTTDYSIPRTS